ncbi:MAG: GNAT family N-acetyltransferase [Akkermansiaceae bacterium]|nr:GNAT family N-acetyltransferase [Roseibacillus sp.]
MTWRKATEADCPLLGALNHQLIADENHRSTMGIPALVERMRGFLSATYKAILFEEEDQVVAYALYHPFEKSDLYLRQFFVVRGQRRQGHGRKAVRLLFDEVFSPDSRLVVTALSHNKRALTFWSEVGFDEYCVSFERLPRKG